MLRFAHPSRALLPLAALLTALLAAALLVPLVASALLVPLVASAQGNGDGDGQQRNEGIPAFPIVYERGTVTLDGEPVASGEIVVRVGDWERRARIPVVDGAFDCANDEGCLLVGPPSDYIDEPVTFHLNGDQQADLTYPFPLLGFPCFVDSVELRFGEGLEPRTEDHCPGVVRVCPPGRPPPGPPPPPPRPPRRPPA
ncbi:MAG: hypothetical protein OXO53_08635, partial [Chloroflexota bacterium]|nr:hypothetical protein [Chloroflexota bacterium]